MDRRKKDGFAIEFGPARRKEDHAFSFFFFLVVTIAIYFYFTA